MLTIFKKSLYVLSAILILSSCEDEVRIDLGDHDPVLTVDAWLDNKSETQRITLTWSTDFFENKTLPPGVSGAEVYVIDDTGARFDFVEKSAGIYEWVSPVSGQGFGEVGRQYDLTIVTTDATYTSSTIMKPTSPVDTVYFVNDFDPFEGDYVRADFQAQDLPTLGDTYWIKAYKNDTLLNRVGEINIAYDAGFSAGGGEDQNGKTFIPPLRFEINDYSELPLYQEGDSVYVEIHSISPEAFEFLNLLVFQSDREAGFGALFESPLANVTTNIKSSKEGEIITGVFNVADVDGTGKKLVLEHVLDRGCFFNSEVEIECPE